MTVDDGARPLTASERFAVALGRPAPPPLTDEQRRDFEARQDRADAEAACIYGAMVEPEPNLREDMAAILAKAGIVVTEAGKARARAKLDAARAFWTPEKWNELRAQIGMLPLS